MSNVWYAIPSARPDGGTIPQWVDMGYKIAVYLDKCPPIGTVCRGERTVSSGPCSVTIRDFRSIPYDHLNYPLDGKYPGYAKAVNNLVREILMTDPQAEWIVTGGDDVSPDPNHTPEEIARQCSWYFSLEGYKEGEPHIPAATFGVMQPTGDRWGENEPWARAQYPDAPAYIDRICGSPWMGREFCRRMYGGKGPLFEGYRHMRVDEELQEVAKKLGVLWQRRDLIQYHAHAQREEGGEIPAFLREVYGPAHWEESTKMFESRKAAGFPGYEPIP